MVRCLWKKGPVAAGPAHNRRVQERAASKSIRTENRPFLLQGGLFSSIRKQQCDDKRAKRQHQAERFIHCHWLHPLSGKIADRPCELDLVVLTPLYYIFPKKNMYSLRPAQKFTNLSFTNLDEGNLKKLQQSVTLVYIVPNSFKKTFPMCGIIFPFVNQKNERV